MLISMIAALNTCKCPWSLNYSGPMAITLNSDVKHNKL